MKETLTKVCYIYVIYLELLSWCENFTVITKLSKLYELNFDQTFDLLIIGIGNWHSMMKNIKEFKDSKFKTLNL